MRLINSDIDNRARITLNKSISLNDINGIMNFGENNDYPQTIEKIILGSPTAKACFNIYAKFLSGAGFENKLINNVVVGKDIRGNNITTRQLLRHISNSSAMFSGVFLKLKQNIEGKISAVRIMPLKNCRFTKADDEGYFAKMAYYENWHKDKDIKFEKENIKSYYLYNPNISSVSAQIKVAGGFGKWGGQVYFATLDDTYLYPLSNFDSVYLDCDTEQQVSIFKNNLTRNGMLKKTVVAFSEPATETEQEILESKIKSWLGADGNSVIAIYQDVNPETGKLDETQNYNIQTIESNVEDKLFENWQKELSNNIRKAIKCPAILIDYEDSKLSGTSGEAIIQATNFYNAVTNDDREFISEIFRNIFSNSTIEELRLNTNWRINPLSLYTLQ